MKHPMVRMSLITIALLLAAPAASSGAEASPSPEYKIKAMFLYHFAKFVKWPEVSPADSAGVIVGILGEDPFGEALDRALEQDSNQEVSVLRSHKLEDLTACNILFIASTHEESVEQTLDQLKSKPVLTVGDQKRFTQHGGIIRFFLQGGKVRFEINVENADRAGLEISAKLLKLARVLPEKRADHSPRD